MLERTALKEVGAGAACKRGREARRTGHEMTEKGDEEGMGAGKVPRVAMDYFFCPRPNGKASENPLLVMADEESGSRYARAVGQKGLVGGQEMSWLIEDMCPQLRAWGHA